MSSSVRFNISADPFFTSSPRAARKSSILPGSPNQPRRSAIKCRLLQPEHLTTTTPFSYDARQTVLTDLVSQTLQVKIIARSCLEDVLKLDLAENSTEELSLLFTVRGTLSCSKLGFELWPSLFSESSLAWLAGFVLVWSPLSWTPNLFHIASKEEFCQDDAAKCQ